MNYKIYTDGSTRGNGKENACGGWAYLILKEEQEYARINSHYDSDGIISTTNQRMELTAAINALTYLYNSIEMHKEDRIIIYSDSAYLINCYQQNWWKNWEKNGWINSKKQPVSNKDLWEQLIPFFKDNRIIWEKVKGHSGKDEHEKWNNYVDNLAQAASQKIKEKI